MSETSRPRILIADDHVLVADAFKRFLATDFDVVATVHDGRSLIQAANTLRPDVILADIGMPFLNGLNAAERIKRALPKVHLIYVTINQDPGIIAEAFRLGASGYLLKTSAASELAKAIHCVMQGKRYLSPSLAVSVPELLAQLDESQSSRYKLTVSSSRSVAAARGRPVDERGRCGAQPHDSHDCVPQVSDHG